MPLSQIFVCQSGFLPREIRILLLPKQLRQAKLVPNETKFAMWKHGSQGPAWVEASFPCRDEGGSMSHERKLKGSQISQVDEVAFDLQSFLPYLIRVFYSDVTSNLQAIYNRDHGLTPSEWRSMSILGATGEMPATEIVERSSMDKVSVSRAVKKMYQRGLLDKSDNADDGRSSLLSLSTKGRAVYADIVPKILAVEQTMKAGLSAVEIEAFTETMAKIRDNLRQE